MSFSPNLASLLLSKSRRCPLHPLLHPLVHVHASIIGRYLEEKASRESHIEAVPMMPRLQADDLINFRQLRHKGAQGAELDIYDDADMSRATGAAGGSDLGSQLNHVYQLSGFADPVYAEASVTVHDYDIVLEILIINRTPNTLTNLTVELATMGDLKLVERPQSLTIGPLDQRTIRANIKVSSTETGHIFGTIVFENSSTAEKSYINLSDVHLDIMDYIHPHTCSDEAFRNMWAEFEWENKVAINTSMTELNEFLVPPTARSILVLLFILPSDRHVFVFSNCALILQGSRGEEHEYELPHAYLCSWRSFRSRPPYLYPTVLEVIRLVRCLASCQENPHFLQLTCTRSPSLGRTPW